MDEPPPLGIPAADWAVTPASVRAALLSLLPLVERVQALEAEVTALRAQLNQSSSNSSKPPSSDPPAAPPRPPRGTSGRQRGGQPGHPGHQRPLLPPDEVTEIRMVSPAHCQCCQAVLVVDLPDAAPPQRHQVWDIPPTQPHVTEYQLRALTCPACATTTRASLPPEVPSTLLGPRAVSLIALLHGRYRVSMREVTVLLADLWGLEVALGSVAASCQTVSRALAPTYTTIQMQVQQQTTANLDETGWREAGQRAWLWGLALGRGDGGLHALSDRAQPGGPGRGRARWAAVGWDWDLGSLEPGALWAISGWPWSGAKYHPEGTRAHLRREFVSFSERDGPVGIWGATALIQLDLFFVVWHGYRDGALTRGELQAGMASIQTAFRQLLDQGKDLPWEKARGFSRDLVNLWPALWTFVAAAGVEPTNNAAERALRPAVLWRKGSFGTQSAAGSRFAERILTVGATCRQQNRHLLTVLTQSVEAYWAGNDAPPLFPTP